MNLYDQMQTPSVFIVVMALFFLALVTWREWRNSTTSERSLLYDMLFRALAALGVLIFVVRVWHAYHREPSFALILIGVGELITLGLVLFAKRTDSRDVSLVSLLSTIFATYYFLLISFEPTANRSIPAELSTLIQVAAVSFQIWAKIILGRSFGLLPANRGIVSSGPYRYVRHPIYTGYAINWAGFVAAYFSWYNLTVLIGFLILQGIRVLREERVLRQDTAYLAFCSNVRFRLLPGVW